MPEPEGQQGIQSRHLIPIQDADPDDLAFYI